MTPALMETRPPSSLVDHYAAALDWWRDAGVDHDWQDTAHCLPEDPAAKAAEAKSAPPPAPKRAEAVVGRYAAGQTVPVYYDPAHPDQAVLEPGNREGALAGLVVGIAFSPAGALFMWLMTHGQWVNGATGS